MLTVLTGLVMGFALLAARVRRMHLSAPIIFTAAGALLLPPAAVEVSNSAVLTLAELTLVVLLFHDASTVQLSRLRHDKWIPVRLLAIGFPVALGFTFAMALGLLPTLGVAGAVLVAGALTPTDAGLGAETIQNPRVPVRVRRALNVESGLNDGLATPVVLLAIGALVAETNGGHAEQQGIFAVGAVPVLLGLGIGVGIGLAAAWALDRSLHRELSTEGSRSIAVMALPLLALGIGEIVEANVFITAFACGLSFGTASDCVAVEPQVSESVELAADVLGYVIWFLAGGLILSALEDGVRWQWVAIAAAALTVLRIIPVAISMIGTHLRWQTLLFIGWFGPRGLATVVFGLIAFEELGQGFSDIGGILAVTVVLSVILHGITAGPLADRYGAWATRTRARIEREPGVEPMAPRGRAVGR